MLSIGYKIEKFNEDCNNEFDGTMPLEIKIYRDVVDTTNPNYIAPADLIFTCRIILFDNYGSADAYSAGAEFAYAMMGDYTNYNFQDMSDFNKPLLYLEDYEFNDEEDIDIDDEEKSLCFIDAFKACLPELHYLAPEGYLFMCVSKEDAKMMNGLIKEKIEIKNTYVNKYMVLSENTKAEQEIYECKCYSGIARL